MSEDFERYERLYCDLAASISGKCTAATILEGEEKEQKVLEIKSLLEDGETLIQKMDIEARGLQPSSKVMLLAKIREYKSEFNSLKTEVKRITSTHVDHSERDELLELGLMTSSSSEAVDQRGKLLMSTERLSQSSERIKDSRRTILETEELGSSILQDLHQQRQSLLNAHNTLHGVDDNISKSKKILTTMSRRLTRNKWIVGTIIGLLAFSILLVLYFKLAH